MHKIVFFFLSLSFFLSYAQEPIQASLYEFNGMEEQAAIKALDAKYKASGINTVEGLDSYFIDHKFDFLKHLVLTYKISTEGFLSRINASQFVCGVGLKQVKDVSPTCKGAIKYQDNAISLKKIEFANLCISRGQKPNVFDIKSCVYKNEFALYKLFSGKSPVSLSDTSSYAEMIEAATSRGYIDFVSHFLTSGVSPNSNDGYGYYVLYRSVMYPEIFNLLLEKGADYKVVGYKNNNVLMHAAREGCIEVLQILLNKGLDPFLMQGGMTANDMAKKYNLKNSKEVQDLFKKYKK